MSRKLTAALLGAVLCSSVHATSVFVPTDSTVNFMAFPKDSSALIGIFDDSDSLYSGNHLSIQAHADQAVFVAQGADYVVTNTSGWGPSRFTLSRSEHFAIAAWSPGLGAWLAPDAVTCSEASGSCLLSWSGLLTALGVDLAEATPYTAAPIPSSVVLLSTGLFGMVAVARRRTIAKRYLISQ